jgi:hypothetical protein
MLSLLNEKGAIDDYDTYGNARIGTLGRDRPRRHSRHRWNRRRVALVWSVLLGVIIAVIGLVAFGGFAKGKWY